MPHSKGVKEATTRVREMSIKYKMHTPPPHVMEVNGKTPVLVYDE